MESGMHFAKRTYHDRNFNSLAVKLLPGEYHATSSGMMISTVLGSCVSVCVCDPINRIGGMNHFMLPEDNAHKETSIVSSARYGTHAMKLLLEHIIKLGGKRNSLEAKVFGAGKVMEGMSNVGQLNAEFALKYLKTSNIQVSAVDVGDVYPRKVIFLPGTGQVFVKRIRNQTWPQL